MLQYDPHENRRCGCWLLCVVCVVLELAGASLLVAASHHRRAQSISKYDAAVVRCSDEQRGARELQCDTHDAEEPAGAAAIRIRVVLEHSEGGDGHKVDIEPSREAPHDHPRNGGDRKM